MSSRTRIHPFTLFVAVLAALMIWHIVSVRSRPPRLYLTLNYPVTTINYPLGIQSAHFDSASRRIYILTDDCYLHLWDFINGGLTTRADLCSRVNNQFISEITVSPDGRTIAVDAGRIYLLDADTLDVLRVIELTGGWSYSHDSRLIAVVNTLPDQALPYGVQIFDVTSGEQVSEFAAHTNEIRSIVFSGDDQQLVTASADGTAAVWDIATGEQLLHLGDDPDEIYSVAYSPDGNWIATSDSDYRTDDFNRVMIWNAHSGEQYAQYETRAGIGSNWGVFEETTVAFSPDSRYLLMHTAGFEKIKVEIRETASGRLIDEFYRSDDRNEFRFSKSTAAFSPDGNYILTYYADTLIVWKLE